MRLTLTFYGLHSALAMRYSFKERMSMTKETLSLKSKGDLTAPSTKAVASTAINAGKNPNKGKAKSPTAATRLIESAIDNNAYVFIQLRQGTGYRGLPRKLDDSWLTLENADIFGTKQNSHVSELLIQLKDGSYIAHIHFAESPEPSKQSDESLGEQQ